MRSEPLCRTRQLKDVEMEIAADQSRIDELVRHVGSTQLSVRQEPLGYDRYWNRYWWLGSHSETQAGQPS